MEIMYLYEQKTGFADGHTIWDRIFGSNQPDFWMVAFSDTERFHFTSCICKELNQILDPIPLCSQIRWWGT